MITGDEESYQYFVESIRMFPITQGVYQDDNRAKNFQNAQFKNFHSKESQQFTLLKTLMLFIKNLISLIYCASILIFYDALFFCRKIPVLNFIILPFRIFNIFSF